MTYRYDPPTAITFLLAGLGLGAILTLVLAPRHEFGRTAMDSRARDREREREADAARAV